MKVLHHFLKHDIIPEKRFNYIWLSCTENILPENIIVIQELDRSNTQSQLQTSNPLLST